ncbi:MAG: hypothetical protein NXI15_10150 [Gammaproteobacteria bacterium]|nr:hypothetical protein [Gammaproteobacteria bacterium]
MNRKSLAITLLVPFVAFTVYALTQVGYVGLFTYQMQNAGGWQVLLDLVVALVLVLSWLIPDARANGRNPWPWVGATLFLGSIGPLAYLAFSKSVHH